MMKEYKGKTKQGRIKPKVFWGFFVILSIATVALFVTYKGFVELSETRESLSKPSQKLIKLNSIITDIYEAESNIRTYTLTQNESYLSLYLSFMITINDKVDSLLLLSSSDAVQAEKIKFIQNLLKRKQQVLNELVVLKQGDQSSRFYQKALEQVESINLDSIQESSVITSVTTTRTSRRDSVISKVPEEDTQSGLSRFFSWFSKKEPTDSIITKLIVDVETQIDTLKRAVMSPSDSLLNEVVRILTEIQTQQEMTLYNISEKELELLRSDKEIMDQIRTIVSLLEREELMNSIELAQEVDLAVKNSTQLLLILGGAAFVMFILFTALIFRDVSRATFYRNQLLHAKQYAEKLLKVKEEFLANMNHEIRTPLSAIVGLSKQLRAQNLNGKQKFIIDSLNSSSEHLLDIVNDILDLSKIEGGHLRFEKAPFNPLVVVQEVAKTFSVKAQEKGIDLITSTSHTDEAVVLGDAFRLKQVLLNLIGNAIKFTNAGRVEISVNYNFSVANTILCQFVVSDTGIGIPSIKIDKIFEEFSQVDSSTTRLYGGTGLGLAIVKKLTELQGGTVEVESVRGKGSTFTVSIPYRLVQNIEEANESQLEQETPKLPSDLNIVVVDDDPISQLLVEEMLKMLGTTPRVFGNPFDAIADIKNNPPLVVLTDIQMPLMSGFDMVKQIKSMRRGKRSVVIALTANNTSNNQDRYIEAGFHCAITKPFNEISLYNTIAPALGLSTVKNQTTRSTNRIEGYDITEIKRFAGDDDQSTCEILQSFIDNSKANVKYLKMFVEQKNWKGVGEVAHRMKSAFRQLKVDGLGQMLEELENLEPDTVDEQWLNSTVEEVYNEVQKVQTLLHRDIENLRVKIR
jgi:signal transduction histidine kinase/DNA-binding response OmpR family regulator